MQGAPIMYIHYPTIENPNKIYLLTYTQSQASEVPKKCWEGKEWAVSQSRGEPVAWNIEKQLRRPQNTAPLSFSIKSWHLGFGIYKVIVFLAFLCLGLSSYGFVSKVSFAFERTMWRMSSATQTDWKDSSRPAPSSTRCGRMFEGHLPGTIYML